MTNDCLFCKLVAGQIPAKIVDETPGCLAFHDVSPQAPVHILIIPKKHTGSLAQSDDPALLGEMLDFARRIAKRECIEDSGYRIVINTGPDGGQSVDHLHVHLLGGRKLSWPPG